MAALVAASPYDGRIRHVRDARYIDWRYRNPLHDYRFLYLRDGAALLGYLVLGRALSDYGNGLRVNVVDWEARDDVLAEALLDAALRYGRFAELAAWSATLPEARRRSLLRAGLSPCDREQTERGLPSILIRAVTGAAQPVGRDVLSLVNWDLRMVNTNAA
jgi:hypothetical protein